MNYDWLLAFAVFAEHSQLHEASSMTAGYSR